MDLGVADDRGGNRRCRAEVHAADVESAETAAANHDGFRPAGSGDMRHDQSHCRRDLVHHADRLSVAGDERAASRVGADLTRHGNRSIENTGADAGWRGRLNRDLRGSPG